MRKILLVIDDYSELHSLDTFFRRFGFDVLSLSKEILVADALLGFVPDLAILTARGRMVDGLRLAPRIRKAAPSARVAITVPTQGVVTLQTDVGELVDAVIGLPYKTEELIRTVCELLEVDPRPLLDRDERLRTGRDRSQEKTLISGDGSGTGSEVDEKNRFVGRPAHGEGKTQKSGRKVSVLHDVITSSTPKGEWDPKSAPGTAAFARSERSDRYDDFLKEHDTDGAVDGTIPRAKLMDASKQLKKASENEEEALGKIFEDKLEFVRELFRRGKKGPKGGG